MGELIATRTRAVPAVELLFPEAGSGVFEDTVAVLVIVELEGVDGETCTVMVNVALDPSWI